MNEVAGLVEVPLTFGESMQNHPVLLVEWKNESYFGSTWVEQFELSVNFAEDCLMEIGRERIFCHAIHTKEKPIEDIDLQMNVLMTRPIKGCKLKHKHDRLELLAGSPIILGPGRLEFLYCLIK